MSQSTDECKVDLPAFELKWSHYLMILFEISDSRSDSEISDSRLLLARMRRHVTFTPDTVFENRRTSKEYRTFTKQQRRLLRKSTSTNLFGDILFEMNNRQNSHLSPQPSRRVVIRPGNYTLLASVVE